MPSLNIDHSIDADDIARAMGGFDESEMKRFVKDFIEELDFNDPQTLESFGKEFTEQYGEYTKANGDG